VGPKETRRLIPIITDEYPDPTFGSGAVKITGAHDFNDYAVAKRGGIPCYRLMDTRAQMRSDGAPYAEAARVAGQMSRAWLVAKGYATPGIRRAALHAERSRDRRPQPRPRRPARAGPVGGAQARGRGDHGRGAGGDDRGQRPATGQDGGEARCNENAGEAVPLVESKPIMQPFGDRSKV
jgi:valyl-tRNA synthetase